MMESAHVSASQGQLSSETVDVDSNTSLDGSEDGAKATSPGDESASRGEDSRKDFASREDGLHPRDPAKKKKASKTAKQLKQSKQDIRREQFLAQVAAKSGKAPAGVQKQDPLPTTGSPPLEQVNGRTPATDNNCLSSDGAEDIHGVVNQLSSLEGVGLVPGLLANGARCTEPAGDGIAEQGGVLQSFSNLVITEAPLVQLEPSTEVTSEVNPQSVESPPPELPPEAIPAVYDKEPVETSDSKSLECNASKKGEVNYGSDNEAVQVPAKASNKKGRPGTSPPDALPRRPSSEALPEGQVQEGKPSKTIPYLNGRNGDSEHSATAVAVEYHGTGEATDAGDQEDDWEAAAEEFSKQVAKTSTGKGSGETEPTEVDGTVSTSTGPSSSEVTAPPSKPSLPGAEYNLRPNQQDPSLNPRMCAPNSLRPEYTYSGTSFSRSRSANDRAWRPDDVSRPPTLPPALTQRSASRGLLGVPLGVPGDLGSWRMQQPLSQTQWPAPNTASQQPACCPICAEELDVTDSSFVPCSCGFRLCLFCHHRIAADDGRCPGCRRAYSPDVASRLSKPPSGWLRL